MKNNWIKKLEKTGSCPKGVAWASQYETAQEAWNACNRGDWMLWAWGENCKEDYSKSHKNMVLACVKISKKSIKYIENKEIEKLVKKSLDTTERWAKGEKSVSLKDIEDSIPYSRYYDTAYACRNHPAAVFAWRAYSATCSACYAGWTNPGDVAGDSARSICVALNRGVDVQDKALKGFADIIRNIQPLCPKFKRVTGWVTY